MDDAATPGPDAGQEIPLAGPPTPAPAPAPVPAKRRLFSAAALRTPMSWPRRRRIGALLAAVAIVTTSGVAIAATSDTPTPTASPDGSGAPDAKQDKQLAEKGKLAKRLHPGMVAGMGRGGVLHGEFTVPNGEDGFLTQVVQTGTVDAVSGDKLTVKSEDGYSHDYALNSDTVVNGARNWTAESRGGIASGQTVTVMATVQDGTATATQVRAGDAKADGEPGNIRMKQFSFRGGPELGLTAPDEKMRMKMREMAPGQQMAPDEMMKKRMDMRSERAVPAPAPPSAAVPQDDDVVPAPSASAGT